MRRREVEVEGAGNSVRGLQRPGGDVRLRVGRWAVMMMKRKEVKTETRMEMGSKRRVVVVMVR
jgi:hypothetical protein